MAQVIDPVCGMTIDSTSASGKSEFSGTTNYFCSKGCKEQFDANPSSYARSAASSAADANPGTEQHDHNITEAGGMVAPKFGSAGSGGAEYEPGPERHKS